MIQPIIINTLKLQSVATPLFMLLCNTKIDLINISNSLVLFNRLFHRFFTFSTTDFS